MVSVAKESAPKRSKAGRPRRLRLDQLIEAALAIGLDKLTMAVLAERLGVAKAVLYGYVGSRKELVQLAAAQVLRHRRFPEDDGQPWSVWILEYARALFEVFTVDGQLLEFWLNGTQSLLVEVDTAELWLRTLTRRGFSGEEALQLRRAVAHLIIGAAASMKHDRALRENGRPRPVSAKKAVLGRSPEEELLLRQFLDVFAREVTEDNWEFGLFLLLQGVTTARKFLEPGASDFPFATQKLPAKA